MARSKATDFEAQLETAILSRESPRKLSWFERCPPEVQEGLLSIRQKYTAGDFKSKPKAVVVRCILEAIRERVEKIPSDDAIERWLTKSGQ